ncbi:MAG: hypothetical protein JXQ23_04245 [Clostridia bacterium]|nr:hypothetical protein [Clostridia bacterium]
MRNKSVSVVFSILNMLAIGYVYFAYCYLKPRLTTTLTEHTALLKSIEMLMIPALAIIGLFHLYLIFKLLSELPHINQKVFLHSVSIVLVLLSGIMLLSDATILSDIGKEYGLFDVSGEWDMLFVLMTFHFTASTAGILLSGRNGESAGIKAFFEAIREGSDILFLSLHQVTFICGASGILVIVLTQISSLSQLVKSSVSFMLSMLFILPVVLFMLYWVFRNRKRAVSQWLDEK